MKRKTNAPLRRSGYYDADYLDKLSPGDKEWYEKNILQAMYLGWPLEDYSLDRKVCYNNNKRIGRDLMNQLETIISIDEIDDNGNIKNKN
jgi:hypothetical protein